MRFSELVHEIIRLGDASRTYWDRELPKHHAHYPVIGAGENPVPPPPEDAQIETLLKSEPDDQLFALALLMYVGRGDFSADHLQPAYQDVKEVLASRDLAIGQLTANKALAEYLTDALDEIHKRRIDLDSLSFANTATVG
jgi:hypothetical protein